jgi:hypothetical protein
MSGFEITNLSGVLKGLNLEADKIERIAVWAMTQVALAVERQAKLNAAQGGTHKRGEPTSATPGSGPARVTGALQRSIHTEVARKGFGSYEAKVFPTMVYSRQVELGGGKWRSGVNYPYMIPAGRAIAPKANELFTSKFAQRWRP